MEASHNGSRSTHPSRKTSTWPTLPSPPRPHHVHRPRRPGPDRHRQHLTPQAATLEFRIAEPDPWCTPCGAMGTPRATITRRLTHVPYGHRPTTLLLRIRRYTCTECGRFWQEDTSRAAPARAKLTRTALDWALRALVLDHLSVNRVAGILGVSWNTANTAILGKGQRRLIKGTTRFETGSRCWGWMSASGTIPVAGISTSP